MPGSDIMSEPGPQLLLPEDCAGIAAFAVSLGRATVEFAKAGTGRCAAAFIAVSGRAVRIDREGDKLRLRAVRGSVLATANTVQDLAAIAKAYLVPGSDTGHGGSA